MKNHHSLRKLVLAAIGLAAASTVFAFQATPSAEAARWAQQARKVTITRDDWGIAHITGKTDADAVFGMIYAQAEDDLIASKRTT